MSSHSAKRTQQGRSGNKVPGTALPFRLKRFFPYLLGVTVFAALAARVAVSAQLLSGDYFASSPPYGTDMLTYLDLSSLILSGKLPEVFYYQPFYYSIFLPFAKLIFGSLSTFSVMGIQSLCGAGTVLLCGLSAAILYGRKAGIFAAVLSAFSAILILYTPYALIETSQAFWITLLFYLTLLAYRKSSLLFWAFSGLILGISILTRGNSWCFLPVMILAVLFSGKIRYQRGKLMKYRVAACALILLTAILPQIPYIVHNTSATGHFSGPSTAGGAVLALGNTPEAPPGGRDFHSGAGPMEYPLAYKIWMDSEKDIPIPKRILDWAFSEPLAFAELTVRKMMLFWDYREIPNNISVDGNGSLSSIFSSLRFIPTGIIILLALAAFFIFFRRLRDRRKFLFLTLFIAFYCAATVAFYILARFRVPIIPLLCVSGGIFTAYFLNSLTCAEDRRKRLMRCGAALLFSLFISFMLYDFYRYNCESLVMRFARPCGVNLRISDSEVSLFDHGPMSFGGWYSEPVPGSLKVSKKFCLKPSLSGDYSSARLSFKLFWTAPGKLNIRAGDVRKQIVKTYSASFPLSEDIELEIPLPSNMETELEFSTDDSSRPCVHLLFDSQRDYGRTSIKGRMDAERPGELVCRLFLKK